MVLDILIRSEHRIRYVFMAVLLCDTINSSYAEDSCISPGNQDDQTELSLFLKAFAWKIEFE